jgi:hypothetical protein
MEYLRKVIKIIDNYCVSVVYFHFWAVLSRSETRYFGWKFYWLQPGERGTVLYHFVRLFNVEQSGDMEVYCRRYNILRRSLEETLKQAVFEPSSSRMPVRPSITRTVVF